MDAAAPKCGKCGRADCGLLATVITGTREYFEAVAACLGAQAQQRARRGGGR